MGMYTQLFLAVDFAPNTPDWLLDVLSYMTAVNNDELAPPANLPAHPLFLTSRWKYMLRCTSAYFSGETFYQFYKPESKEDWNGVSLTVKCSLKNYDNEIEKFLDLITPYIDYSPSQIIGFKQYEESSGPTILRIDKKEGKNVLREKLFVVEEGEF